MRRVLYSMEVRFSLVVWLITMICSSFHMKVKLPIYFFSNASEDLKVEMVGFLSGKEMKNMKIARALVLS